MVDELLAANSEGIKKDAQRIIGAIGQSHGCSIAVSASRDPWENRVDASAAGGRGFARRCRVGTRLIMLHRVNPASDANGNVQRRAYSHQKRGYFELTSRNW